LQLVAPFYTLFHLDRRKAGWYDYNWKKGRFEPVADKLNRMCTFTPEKRSAIIKSAKYVTAYNDANPLLTTMTTYHTKIYIV